MLESKDYTRREIIALTGKAVFGFGLAHRLISPADEAVRPSLYWSAREMPGLRSVSAVRESIRNGTTSGAYARIRGVAEAARDADPIIPSTPLEHRSPAAVANANPDFFVTNGAAQRVLQSAFVTVVEDDSIFAEPAIVQLESIFDDRQWPRWMDQAHEQFGHPVDLRTGMLANAVGLAYDWLHPYLSPARRGWIVRELDRRAIQPFRVAIGQDPWWLRDKNNWMTTIVGGMGIAGMALRNDHPESDFLVQFALARMEDYLSIYGPNGEFNESVAYGNATVRPVALFQAHRYWSNGAANRLSEPPFPQTCRWIQYLTLPPGRVAAFGDSHADRPPWTSYIAAVAAAVQDPVMQWFQKTYGSATTEPVAFLWNDPSLLPVAPQHAGWPLGRSFPAHGGCLTARTDWSPDAARCVVYGKAGREENHEHNDVGQLCIDALGERLIIDLGSPSGYPADFFDEGRYEYYNASVRGHNVLMFDSEEMRVPSRLRGEPIGDQAVSRSGSIIQSQFEDSKGAIWSIDCTNAYDGVDRVVRSVLFLTPGVVVVVDEAMLPRTRDVSLRWHTIEACSPEPNGAFSFHTERSAVLGRIVPLSGAMTFSSGHHEYHAPYNRNRDGDLLEQRREPFIEARCRTNRFAVGSLFYAGSVSENGMWALDGDRWILRASDVQPEVTITDKTISIIDRMDGREWKVARP